MPDNEFYGPNSITGTKADAEDPLKGRDVKIQTTNTNTITLGQEDNQPGQEDPNKKPEDADKDPDKEPDKDPEDQLQDDLNKQLQADKDAQADLEAKGVDWKALETEYENGGFSDETYAKLEKAGYPRSVVDAYVAGLEAQSEKFQNAVFGFAGGKDEFVAVSRFVQGMGKAYVNAFNATIETGNLLQIKTAIDGYKAQMVAKYGTQNRTVMGQGSQTSGVQGYASRAEMEDAMSDKRYGRDKAYTREVEAKTLKTKF